MSNAQDSIKRVINAKTVRDVMQAGFPQKVDNIPDPDAFDGFAKGLFGAGRRTTMAHQFDAHGNLNPIVDDRYKAQTPESQAAFSGVQKVITAAEVQALGDRLSGSSIAARGLAKDRIQSPTVHPDLTDDDSPYGSFRGRNYVASTKNATLIVPDEAALEVIKEFPISALLDLDLDEPENVLEIRQQIYDFNMANFDLGGYRDRMPEMDADTAKMLHEMHDRLQACLEPQEDGVVTVMSNLTFHARNLPFANSRVFFQGIGYDPEDSTLNNTLDL